MNALSSGIFWYWNATPTAQGICKQLKHIAEAGFDCVYIHPMPDDFHRWNFFIGMKCSYLGKKYFDLVETALYECKKLGLTLMLYDEGGWPSGGVLDRLVARYPECRGTFLVRGKNGDIQKITADFPDLLDKKSTEHFIEMTHEKYFRRFGSEFGKTIKGIFTDEPFFRIVNDEDQVFYTPEMETLSLEMFDSSFTDDLLPYLWHGMENHPAAPGARRKYMAIASRLFAENYFAVLEKWCNDHHIALAGHVDHEDTFFRDGSCGDLPEQFAHLHIPGVDAIWRQIYPNQATGVYASFASSAAIANRRTHALCECFNVYSYALPPKAVNWIANALFIRGINHLIIMPYLYSDFGKHKICCSTDFSPRLPWWQAMKELLRRWKIAADFDLSKMELPVWVLARNKFAIPDCMWEQNPDRINACNAMEKMLHTFDTNGVPWRFTSTGELQKTQNFPAVLVVNQHLDKWEQQLVDELARRGTEIVSSWDEKLKKFAPITIHTPDRGCLVRSCIRDNQETVMIFNPADSAVDFAFSSVENWGESVLDKAVTELYPLKKADTAYTVTIPPGVLRILVKEQTLYAEKAWKNLPLTLSWQLKKAKKLRMAAEKPTVFQSVALPADFLSAGMHKQADFSGILTVTTTIKMAAAAEGYLVFDQICHAGKLSVNGKDCGTQIAEPWAFPVTLQQGENHLTLEIYSTAGNEWRRCVNEELEPRQWVNCYLPKLRKYTIDDAESGVLATATLWLPNKE